MMEYKDNDFGNFIKSIRNKNKINAETLVRGICSVKVLNNIESGKTILRLPNTRKNEREVLNLSYVITSSNAFYATLDKVVAGLNAAGFTSKDYRVDDCEAVVDEQQTTQEVNSQTELPLDNIQVSNDDKDTDELDRLNVELMKMQLETLERESTETGTEDSTVSSNAINDMLEHAKSQNELYTNIRIEGLDGERLKYHGISCTTRTYDMIYDWDSTTDLYCYYAVPDGCGEYMLECGNRYQSTSETACFWIECD